MWQWLSLRPFVSVLTGLLAICHLASGQDTVAVGLVAAAGTGRITVSVNSGKYVLLYGNDTLHRLGADDPLQLRAQRDSVEVKGLHMPRVMVRSARIVSLAPHGQLSVQTEGKPLRYPDDLSFIPEKGKLKLVNHVMLDHYVAYVVQAEGGGNNGEEYHRIQAILCRTYAMKNRTRHRSEGYDLCDRQHCQVYDPARVPTLSLSTAVASTAGLIIVDRDGRPIDAAYHANCGGQTANSEDVWTRPISYLRSVRDPYCKNARSATWSLRVDTAKVAAYLRAEGLLRGPVQPICIDTRDGRCRSFKMTDGRMSMMDLRGHLNLRSSWFDMRCEGPEAVFTGRGFGHGVGLCQQGAIEMVRRGHDFRQVLGFYYTDTRLVDMHAPKSE